MLLLAVHQCFVSGLVLPLWHPKYEGLHKDHVASCAVDNEHWLLVVTVVDFHIWRAKNYLKMAIRVLQFKLVFSKEGNFTSWCQSVLYFLPW
jgi:hypothetical protein